jgi:hypothetical protein
MNQGPKTTKGKAPYKGKKPYKKKPYNPKYSKEDAKDVRGSESEAKVLDHNNVEWYGGGSVIAEQACKIPFTYPLGMQMPEEYYSTANAVVAGKGPAGTDQIITPLAAPGFMTLTATVTPGRAESAASPVNIAMRKIYANVRKNNSGAANYEPVDLFMYIMSMDEIYSIWSHIMRAFGFVHYYTSMNRYYAEAAYLAMGVTYSSMVSNVARYRAKFNILSAKINSFAVPNTMTIFKRHGWLFQNIYMDSPEDKAQGFVVVPAGYRTFEPFEEETGGFLEYTPIFTQNFSALDISDWLDILETMIDKMTVNEDMNVMSGDIEKAYGSDALVKLGMITETLMLQPLYDEGFLNQCENAVVCGLPADNDIEQENGNIKYNPSFISPYDLPSTFDAWKDLRFLNAHSQNPSSDDVLQATRWAVMGGTSGDSWTPAYFGSDILCSAHFVVSGLNELDVIVNASTPAISSVSTWDLDANLSPQAIFQYLKFLWSFNRAPEFLGYTTYFDDPDTIEYQLFRSMQLDNFGFLDSDLASTIHQAALIYLFGVQNL